LTGKIREVTFPIYSSYGVDDIGSCVDWLISVEHWKKRKQTIVADDLDMEGTREKIIKLIEEKHLEKQLQKIVGSVWNSIEESLKLNRRKKYE
jgi:hypothetical protein